MPPRYADRLRHRRPDPEPLLVALLAGAAGVAGSFAVAGFTPGFVAGPIAGALARWLPASVVTFAIVVLGDLGEALGVLLALGLSVLGFAAATLLGREVGRWLDRPWTGRLFAAAAAAGLAFGVTGAPVASVAAGVGVGLVLSTAGLGGTMALTDYSPARRRVLGGAAGALAAVLGGYTVGARSGRDDAPEAASVPFEPPEPIRADIDDRMAEAGEKSLAVAGLEPLVSDEFYEVDINPTNPTVDASAWALQVTGAVDRELRYTYADIVEREPENRFVTLRCVGETLNGNKMDNALWTGVPIADLIEPAGVAPTCCVMLHAADGYYEQFPLGALDDAFLAYGMNGEALPRGHGYPVRALIPGHWGEINVKWLTAIEVLEEEQDGYWEQRGWHGTGPVNTVAKLHVVNHLPDGRIEVAGHAYAGTRGIRRVEVSVDDGASWAEATLSAPLPGDDVWRQWVLRYDPPGEIHDVVVRATDGTGTRQPREESSPFPSGPSGWVTRSVRP